MDLGSSRLLMLGGPSERHASIDQASVVLIMAKPAGGPSRHRLNFADAYLVASAEPTGVEEVVSFDRAIDHMGQFAGSNLHS